MKDRKLKADEKLKAFIDATEAGDQNTKLKMHHGQEGPTMTELYIKNTLDSATRAEFQKQFEESLSQSDADTEKNG